MEIRIVPLSEALERRRRLRTPDNAVPDRGIDLPVVIAVSDKMEIAQLKIKELEEALVKSEKQSETRRQKIIHLESRLEKLTGDRAVSVANILECVAAAYCVSVADIYSNCQKKEFADPRHVAMYLAKTLTIHSAVTLCRMFGRDGTSILHGWHKVEHRRLTDTALDIKLRHIEQRFVSPTKIEAAPCNSPQTVAQ